MTSLDERSAFVAMRRLLQNDFERGNRSVAEVLADIDTSATKDGSSADPAKWFDWLQAITETRGDESAPRGSGRIVIDWTEVPDTEGEASFDWRLRTQPQRLSDDKAEALLREIADRL